MKFENINNKSAQELKESLAPSLITHPLMMFLCPEKSNRAKFIDAFLDYYLFSWTKYGEAYLSTGKAIIASLVSKGAFEYKFSGKNAMRIKHNKYSNRIFAHREAVENILNIIVPDGVESRVLNFYGSYQENPEQVKELVEELKAHAQEKGFALVYETFSKRMIPFMQEQGFEIAYQKQFYDTQFIQTAMTYNI